MIRPQSSSSPTTRALSQETSSQREEVALTGPRDTNLVVTRATEAVPPDQVAIISSIMVETTTTTIIDKTVIKELTIKT